MGCNDETFKQVLKIIWLLFYFIITKYRILYFIKTCWALVMDSNKKTVALGLLDIQMSEIPLKFAENEASETTLDNFCIFYYKAYIESKRNRTPVTKMSLFQETVIFFYFICNTRKYINI